MRISEINTGVIFQELHIMEDDVDEAELRYLDALKTAAISYVTGYTGLCESELDSYEDITIAALVLISDMYDNRQMYVDKNYSNRVIETILNMHRINLVPGGAYGG